ncbi:hypothetical protein DL93DRAFT_2234654, partial [Clavulina sp. PMI_390]
MASSSMYSLSMQRLELSSNLPLASDVSSASSLPISYKLPSTHAFGNMHNSTLRETEPNAVHSDRNPSASHPPPHSPASEALHPANVSLGMSNLGTRFGILDPHDLSQLPRTEAAKILDQIYINVQNHAPGSVEYPHALRLLQDCCYHAGLLPTQL